MGFLELFILIYLLASLAIAIPSHLANTSLTTNPGIVLLTTNEGNHSAQANLTLSSLKSTNSKPIISCDGQRYRRNLKKSSCMDAVHQIPQGSKTLLFGLRIGQRMDVILPSRFISGKSCSHQLCISSFY